MQVRTIQKNAILPQVVIDSPIDQLHRNQSMETCPQIETSGHRFDPAGVYGSDEVHEWHVQSSRYAAYARPNQTMAFSAP